MARRMDKDTYSPEKVILTPELIDGFLAGMAARGARKDTLGTYRNRLEMFYHYLPEDKRIRRGAVNMWAEALRGQGYAGRTVNQSLSIANSLLAWAGRRDLQGERVPVPGTQAQPELTRGEYLRLLSTARSLGKDRAYLLAKVFATTGVNLQNLSRLTVEAVREDRVQVTDHGSQRPAHIPACVKAELLAYARRKGILRGPIFVTRGGAPLNRVTASMLISGICRDAQVPREKGNPRCLKRLYQATQAGIEANISLLVEQAHDQMIEMEQAAVGWNSESAIEL